MRICVIGPSRFPVAEPFAGGLEAFVHALVQRLVARGHEVALFAAEGTDPSLPVEFLEAPQFLASPEARADVGASPERFMTEFHAYQSLVVCLAETGQERFDVVLNCCIHPLPIAASRLIPLPVVTTLHTPPTDMIESALLIRGHNCSFVTVSEFMREAWRERVDTTVIHNGVDVDAWRFGEGGPAAVWFGRIVPEKGTKFAVQAARAAGIPLQIAGPRHDPEYFAREIEPYLGEHVSYLGHLGHASLREVVRRSAAALITPMWNEPYGLVAAEALAAGTPVAAFARGALPEIITPETGYLVDEEDATALATALELATQLSRTACRERAESFCSLDRMTDAYEEFLARVISEHGAA